VWTPRTVWHFWPCCWPSSACLKSLPQGPLIFHRHRMSNLAWICGSEQSVEERRGIIWLSLKMLLLLLLFRVQAPIRWTLIWFSYTTSSRSLACDCLFLLQDKLSVALERVQLQTEEATLFQRQTNEKSLLIKVQRYVCYCLWCIVKDRIYILNCVCMCVCVRTHACAHVHRTWIAGR